MQPHNLMYMKKCTKCKEIKDISSFMKRSRQPDGYDYTCKACKSKDYKLWRNSNKDKKALSAKTWRENNKEHLREYFALRSKKLRRLDASVRLKNNLRRRLHKAIKGHAKSKSTMDILGIDIEGLRAYLEPKFHSGMSWDNYGKWHMDHIVPLASASTVDEIEKLFHYTNLQPLWALDNQIKSAKMPTVNL